MQRLATHDTSDEQQPLSSSICQFQGRAASVACQHSSSTNQCFVEWRMNLLTEQHAVGLMTQSMNDIMHMSLTSESTLSRRQIFKCDAACARAHNPTLLVLHFGISSPPPPVHMCELRLNCCGYWYDVDVQTRHRICKAAIE